jgi:hypothetical protein
VEGVVIVGSILLALGVDAWWEGVQERALELEYAERLEASLIADTVRFSQGEGEMAVKAALLRDLARTAGIPPPVDDAGAMMGRLFLSSYWAINETRSETFREMESAGRLGLLRDPDLRDELAKYYAFHGLLSGVLDESFGRYREVLMGAMPGELWQAYQSDPSTVDPRELDRGLRALVAHPELETVLNAELGYASSQLVWTAELKRRALLLLAQLAEVYPDP